MKISVETEIRAPAKVVWDIITDIKNSPEFISGIDEVEVLDSPADGLVGLKWKETRTLFGRTATEIMWITEAVENEYYKVRAESHGALYLTDFYLSESNGVTTLKMDFDGTPQTLGAKIMSALTGFMFKKSTEQAVIQDLEDIKAAAEKR
ncbi:MAG: SRPBCC family protein [Anaerolineae bacterium]|nr:SRPBCC family protein [Anaerolineae bacterium]